MNHITKITTRPPSVAHLGHPLATISLQLPEQSRVTGSLCGEGFSARGKKSWTLPLKHIVPAGINISGIAHKAALESSIDMKAQEPLSLISGQGAHHSGEHGPYPSQGHWAERPRRFISTPTGSASQDIHTAVQDGAH